MITPVTQGAGIARIVRIGVAVAIGGALALSVVPLGLHTLAGCAVLDLGCPPREPRGRLPELTRLTPVEVALSGGYVALGDSYSSGEGVYESEQAPAGEGAARCHRSQGSYAPQVAGAHAFGGGAGFWACSGATTGQLLRGQYGHAPQVSRVTAETTLVTLSIGGNDAGFAPVLTECIAKLPWSSACVDQDAEVRRRIEELRPRLREVLAQIRARAPRARVIVLGYPRPFPAEPSKGVTNLSVTDQRWLNGVTRRLNDVVGAVAREFEQLITAFGAPGSVEYVDAYDAFDGHEVGRPRPYLNGLVVDLDELTVNARSFHPTADGYRRFAGLVNERIVAGPGRPMNDFRLTPP
ncbi:SGNH/GDSL hydrolase family protein [Nonomuraea sp. SBT364]|uniref:SGNH/GDSL hydrolase family protein n=1 Tax=Nonomuraea sp. SBT364 TaxID=1580530 RepID=UPI00066D9E1C|nr:SGNH/GDSL hydrolase family protein [Nonomuraea sp. SBT364]